MGEYYCHSYADLCYLALWNWESLRPRAKTTFLISGTQFIRRVHKPTIGEIFK